MANKYNILFFLQSESGRNDLRLRCRVRWSSNIVSFNVGYRVEKDKWSKETQRCIRATTHGKRKIQANTINREIERLESRIVEYFDLCAITGETPTLKRLRVTTGREQQDKSLFDIYDEFVEILGQQREWSRTYYAKMRTTRNHLYAYRPDLTFADLNEDVLYGYIAYLQSPDAMHVSYPNIEQGLKNTTISRMIGFLKYFLRWASEKGYYAGDLHNTFRPHLKGLSVKTIIYLDWDELMTLYNFDFTNNDNLGLARDVFCFSSFTALRFSDLMRLSWADVNIATGEINIVTQKTSKRTVVALNKFSRAIIDKYYACKDDSRDKVFPLIHNSLLNRFIKDAAKLAGIDTPVRLICYVGANRIEQIVPKYEALSIHAGRRTFAVNALSMGVSVFVVKEIGGWANVKSMTPYATIVDRNKREAINMFDTWDGKLK